jgi:histone H3/H4
MSSDSKRRSDYELQVPISRVKRVMRADPDVHIVPTDVAWAVGKAMEHFVIKLSKDAYRYTAGDGRKHMAYKDLANAIGDIECYDVFADHVPRKLAVADAQVLLAKRMETAKKTAELQKGQTTLTSMVGGVSSSSSAQGEGEKSAAEPVVVPDDTTPTAPATATSSATVATENA